MNFDVFISSTFFDWRNRENTLEQTTMIADALHKLTTGSLIALTLYYTAFMGSRGVDIVQGVLCTCTVPT